LLAVFRLLLHISLPCYRGLFLILFHLKQIADKMRGLILLAVSLLTNFCIAQNSLDDNKKFSFGYNYGTSFPEGNFGKSDQSKLPMSRFSGQDTNKLNGYAKKGIHYDFYASYKIIRYISIMLSVAGDQNDYDINTLNSQYIQYAPPNTVAVTTGDNYNIVQYLIGPYINIPIINNLSTEIKALAGFTTANYPGLNYLGLPSGELLYTTPNSSAIGYAVGLGLKYTAVKTRGLGLGLHLNVNYAASNITYSRYSITAYTPANTYINSTTYNYPKSLSLSILQITYGISLEF
jgi:hypothetical protein